MKKVILVILDGWGKGPDPQRSAITQAETPYVDSLYSRYPNSELITYGTKVGLPEGQMGNSEVGHLNIGAGRIVYQELERINKALRDGSLAQNEKMQELIQLAKSSSKKVHVLGLLSDGGVHSHIDHINGIGKILEKEGIETYIHAFTDGRDTDPKSGAGFLHKIQEEFTNSVVKLASVVGRFYAMDRDNRWERIKKAYDVLVHAEGKKSSNIVKTVEEFYEEGITDEFMEPIVSTDAAGNPLTSIEDGDIVFFANFRTDRPRELTTALSQSDFPEQNMKKLDLHFYTMTSYDHTYHDVKVIFTKDNLEQTLGEVLSNLGKTQVRIAETEKYPHVTYFFSGGREEEFPGEKRILIPSPKVQTYDLQPEMSAPGITKAIIDEIQANQPDFICLNYANTDMVGHTGVFEAAMAAATTVDALLEELMKVSMENGYTAVVIADHGNCDYMINDDGTPNTAHTMNPVPLFIISDQDNFTVHDGKLGDIAPTILHIMGEKIPEMMDGEILVSR